MWGLYKWKGGNGMVVFLVMSNVNENKLCKFWRGWEKEGIYSVLVENVLNGFWVGLELF